MNVLYSEKVKSFGSIAVSSAICSIASVATHDSRTCLEAV